MTDCWHHLVAAIILVVATASLLDVSLNDHMHVVPAQGKTERHDFDSVVWFSRYHQRCDLSESAAGDDIEDRLAE